MKYLRILGAIGLTALMLYVARRNSVGAPEYFEKTDGEYQFSMTTVPKGMENGDTVITVDVVGPFAEGHRVLLYLVGDPAKAQKKSPPGIPMQIKERGASEYSIRMPVGKRNEKIWYRFAVVDESGQPIARFARPDGSPFVLRSIGHVPVLVLIFHILFIFATFFCVAMAALSALPLVAGGGDLRALSVWYWAAAICAFVGGYPFGFAMNWFAFGGLWEGVPFGTDATDNKTQLLFVYLLFMSLATIGSFSKGKCGRDIFTPRTLGLFGLAGFLLQLGIYFIPHSIQFSAGLTYAVCYGFTALIALIYLLGLFSSRGTSRPSSV
jgi:hypothetical protein